MIQSQSFIIRGEGLVDFGLEYRKLGTLYPNVGAYGVLTFGFVWNRDEVWGPIGATPTSHWSLSNSVTLTSWTATIGATLTSWTLFTGVTATTWSASVSPLVTSWSLSF